MATETRNTVDKHTVDTPPTIPAPRSQSDIAFGIASTLIATAIGAIIGHKMGGWGNKPAEVYDGHHSPANNKPSKIVSVIMGLFSGALAFHANFRNSAVTADNAKNQEKSKTKIEKIEPDATMSNDGAPKVNTNIAGAAVHEGYLQANSQKIAM